MNRKTICNTIIQSIKDYISTPENLEAHRAAKHFVRNVLLSMHIIQRISCNVNMTF